MKIAYLFGSLNRGGTETLLLDVFRNAEKYKLDAIGFYRKSGTLETDFLETGIKMYRIPTGKNPIAYIFRLRNKLLANNIDIIHAQQPIDALYAKIASIGTTIKVVLTFHGYDFNEDKLSLKILKYIITNSRDNIYVSEFQRKYYIDKYHLNPDFQHVVYNGISFDKLDDESILQNASDQTRNKLRTKLKLSQSTILLGSVGNFVSGRDQLTLCRYLKLLNDHHIDFHFVFVGKKVDSVSQLYDNCYSFCKQNKLLDNITFLGSCNNVPEILHQLDTFLYATDHDTFGIAVVEALAVGIPVFVNDWGVMSEITVNGKYATLYKTKDETDLLQKFMLFLQYKPVYQEKANEASRFVRDKFSIEKHIDNLKRVYQQVINHSSLTNHH